MDDLDQKLENNHEDFNELPGSEAGDAMGTGASLEEQTLGGNGTSAADRVDAEVIPIESHTPTQDRSPWHSGAIRKLLNGLSRNRTNGDRSDTALVGTNGDSDAHTQVATLGSENGLRSGKSEDQPEVISEGGGKWQFKDNAHNLYVDIAPTDDTEEVLYGIPPGTLAGKMDFAPLGRKKLKPHQMSENLLYGIKGLQAFFAAIDASGNPAPEKLYGVTNKRMADAAVRTLGFEKTTGIIKKFSLADNRFDRLLRKRRVVGDTLVVREKLDKLVERGVVGTLEKRVASAKAA